jgi:hypothetical protein
MVCTVQQGTVGDLRAFDDGKLEDAQSSVAQDIQEVRFQMGNPSLLCSDYTIQLSASGTISLERRRCRMRLGKQTRKVYCDRQEGHTYQFDRLARFLAGSGVLAQPESGTSDNYASQDVGEMTLIVTLKSGVRLSRYWKSPDASMSQWETVYILMGMIADQEWIGRPKEVPCPAR